MFEIGVTVGEGCIDSKDIDFCFRHGVTKFRVNLSSSWARQNANRLLSNIKKSCCDMSKVDVLWDVPFPRKKIRYSTLEGRRYDVSTGDVIELVYLDGLLTTGRQLLIPRYLFDKIAPQDRIIIGDGETSLVVRSRDSFRIVCLVSNDWFVSDSKSLTIEGCKTLIESKVEDLYLSTLPDWSGSLTFACSFIHNSDDVALCREKMPESSLIMSKIETKEGVENIDDVASVSDLIMIARGDLALNVGLENLGESQDKVLNACNRNKKSVFIATEILSSLSYRASPLRAELSDIFQVSKGIKNGGVFLTKESSMPEMLQKTLPIISSVVKSARSDFYNFNSQLEVR